MKRQVAKNTKAGTSRSKTAVGVWYNSAAPNTPPTMLGTSSLNTRGSALRSSRRYPHALAAVPGQIATVFVILAVTEGTPSQIKVGNDTRDPPPATELMPPAATAERNTRSSCTLLQNTSTTVRERLEPRFGARRQPVTRPVVCSKKFVIREEYA